MSEAIIQMGTLILGFGLIIPLIENVFVFNRGLVNEIFGELLLVLTALKCQTLLILIAVQGVSLVLLTFSWLTTTLYMIGFFFLMYMGWVIWRSDPSNDVKQEKSMPLKNLMILPELV